MSKREWRFYRYRTDHWGNRRRMAEGARVHAVTEAEARQQARELFREVQDEFVLRDAATEESR